MSEENVETTEQEETIWERLGIPNPDDEEAYAAEAEDAEAEAEEEDKIARKMSAKVDDLQKKFDAQVLANRRDKFLEKADPVEKDLFKAIAGDVKDPATLDRAIVMVVERAKQMRESAAKYEAEMKEQAAKAWGVNPGRAAAPAEDEMEERQKKIERGDTHAALSALLENDSMVSGIIS